MARRLAVLLALAALLASARPVAADDAPQIIADLEGRVIASTEVGEYHCHDFDFPRIHCFTSSAELEAAVAALGVDPGPQEPASMGSGDGLGILATNYVRIFADASFGGSSAYLSANYSDLSSIGWNDRISSFYGLNSARGEFWEHKGYTGFVYGFCCNQQVSYVGDAYNDKFSSVRRV